MPLILKKGLFLLLCVLTNHAMAQERHPYEIVTSALPLVKKVASYLDTEVADKILLTSCATGGGALGHSLSISILKWFYGPHVRFDHTQHLEDDVGWCVGVAAGYKVGEFAVKLRHSITDPIFASGVRLTLAFGNAGKKFVEDVAATLTLKVTTKMNAMEQKLNAYGAGKKGK